MPKARQGVNVSGHGDVRFKETLRLNVLGVQVRASLDVAPQGLHFYLLRTCLQLPPNLVV